MEKYTANERQRGPFKINPVNFNPVTRQNLLVLNGMPPRYLNWANLLAFCCYACWDPWWGLEWLSECKWGWAFLTLTRTGWPTCSSLLAPYRAGTSLSHLLILRKLWGVFSAVLYTSYLGFLLCQHFLVTHSSRFCHDISQLYNVFWLYSLHHCPHCLHPTGPRVTLSTLSLIPLPFRNELPGVKPHSVGVTL